MAKEIFATKLLGLNVTSHPKNLRDNELVDMTNLQVTRFGELVRRKGLRVINSESLPNRDEDGDPLFNLNSRIKYKQVYTPAKEYLNIFAVRNKVYVYDDDSNEWETLYEAPGNAEVDIQSYLGFILVTSHTSNLSILRRYVRNSFLLDRGNRIIKSKGTIVSDTEINFKTEDEISDTDLEDITFDQAQLYSLKKIAGSPQTFSLTPSSQAEISNIVAESTNQPFNNYFDELKVLVGFDDQEITGLLIQIGSGLQPLLLEDQKVSNKSVDDFTNGNNTLIADISVQQKYKLTKGTKDGIRDGIVFDGLTSISSGTFRDNKNTFTTNKVSLGSFIDASIDKEIFFARQLKVNMFLFGIAELFFAKKAVTLSNVMFSKVNINTQKISGNVGIALINYKTNKLFSENISGVNVVFVTNGFLEDGVTPAEIVGIDKVIYGVVALTQEFFVGKFSDPADYTKRSLPSDMGATDFAKRSTVIIKEGATERFNKSQDDNPKFNIKGKNNITLTNLTFVEFDMTIDDSVITLSTAINTPQFAFNKNLPPSSQGFKEDEKKGDNFEFTTTGVTKSGAISINPYKVFYQFKTRFTPLSPKHFVPNGRFNQNNIQIRDDSNFLPIVLNVTFDLAFTDRGVSKPTEYDIKLDTGTDNLDSLRIDAYQKDNLNITRQVMTLKFILKTPLPTNPSRFGKVLSYLIYLETNTNKILLAVDKTGGSPRYVAIKDVSSLGVIKSSTDGLKSFINHNGRLLALYLTDKGLHLLRVNRENRSIVIIDQFTKVGSDSEKIIDFTNLRSTDPTNSYTDIYCLMDGTTSSNIIRVRLTDDNLQDGDGEKTIFERVLDSNDEFTASSDVKIDRSITVDGVNPLPYYIRDVTANFPKMIEFVLDEKDDIKLLTDDTASDPNGSNFIEFKVNGINTHTFDSILTDDGIANIEQIKPITTPVKPTIQSGGAGATLTGIYVYFWVAVESRFGNSVYESYPSEFSFKLNVSGSGIQFNELTTNYQQFDPHVNNGTDDVTVKLQVYRAKVESYTDQLKITDFFRIDDIVLVETIPGAQGPPIELGSRLWEIGVALTDDDVIDAVAEANDKHRGYSNFYPRSKFVEVYNNIAYTANDFKFPNNIYFSEIFDPTAWAPQLQLAAGEQTNNEITAMIQNDGLYVFTRDEAHLITGFGLNITKTQITKEIGCVDARTLVVVDNVIVMLSEKGIYLLKGYNYQPIDTPVSRITEEFVLTLGLTAYFDNFNREYRIIYDNNKVLAFSLPLRTWFKFEYPYDKILFGFVRENRETDIPENVFIVASNNTEGDNITRKYRMLVEDELISQDFIRPNETVKIKSVLYTKYFAMGNDYLDKIYRRVHIDTVNSHELTVSSSIDQGEYLPIVQQRKRKFFNEVPFIWHRFNELFGSSVVNFGTGGGKSTSFDIEKNQDGKIDRAYQFTDTKGSHIGLGDIPIINQLSILFWFFADKTKDNGPNLDDGMLVLSDRPFLNIPFSATNFVDSDFFKFVTDLPASADPLNKGDFSDTLANDMLPMQTNNSDVQFKVGSFSWQSVSIVGLTFTFLGLATGVFGIENGGTVSLEPKNGSTWNTFSGEADGTKTITFNSIGISDMKIGSTFYVA